MIACMLDPLLDSTSLTSFCDFMTRTRAGINRHLTLRDARIPVCSEVPVHDVRHAISVLKHLNSLDSDGFSYTLLHCLCSEASAPHNYSIYFFDKLTSESCLMDKPTSSYLTYPS